MARAQAPRRQRPRAPARKRTSSAEDLMFFPKLRRRAKWVFLFLALAFGIGFVAFGVGTGVPGTSLGDVFQDFLGQRDAGAEGSVEETRASARENPNDREAQIAYVNALQREGRTQEAISVLQQYTTRRPRDGDALRQLAALWGAQAAKARQEAQTAQIRAQQASLGQTLAPDSPFFQQITQGKIGEVLSQQAQARADEASFRAQTASRSEAAVYEQLTLLEPDDAGLFLQLGVASQGAQDYEAAIAAYERFLELAPDDSSAPIVREQVEILKQVTGQIPPEEAAEEPDSG